MFLVSAGITGVVLLGCWLLLKGQPRDVDLSPPPVEASARENAEPPPHPLASTTLARACLIFVRSPRVWLICLGMVFLTILMDFIVFIPIYLSKSLNLDPAIASMTGSTFPAGMFLAPIVTGVFYDRFSKRQLVKLLGGSMAISCLCAATLWALPSLPISSAMQTPLALIAIFLFGFTISPAYYIPMSLFSIAYGGKHSGFLIAFIDVCGYSGALLFNFFGGSIAQTYGWSVFLAGLISIAVLALVTMTWFLHLNANAEQQPA